MTIRKITFHAALAVLVGTLAAQAQNLTAVRPLDNYKCMALNLTQQQMMDPSVRVPILSQPNASSPATAYAIATVIASTSPPQNGFQSVVRMNGIRGWIASKYLKPWTNPSGNGRECIPSVMSNGRLGFDFK